MTSLFQILMLLLNILYFIVIAHVIMSWLINFQVLNLRQPLVAQIWDGLNRLLEPIYSRVRQVIPPMGGLDLAPLVAIIGIQIIRILLQNRERPVMHRDHRFEIKVLFRTPGSRFHIHGEMPASR